MQAHHERRAKLSAKAPGGKCAMPIGCAVLGRLRRREGSPMGRHRFHPRSWHAAQAQRISAAPNHEYST